MRILVSTPAHGGQLYEYYVGSLVSIIGQIANDIPDFELEIHIQGKESLIHRARNRAARHFIDGGYDKLFTIDADVVFTYEDFRRIVTSSKPVVGGVYPLKTFPIVMNFNPLEGKGTELFSSHRGFDYDAWSKFCSTYADPETGLAEVRHVATGFMCVTREVFATLSHKVEHYWDFQSDTGHTKAFHHFYPSQVRNASLLSEDWYFTELCRENGYPVFLDTKVTLGHAGTHVYRLGQFFGEQQT